MAVPFGDGVSSHLAAPLRRGFFGRLPLPKLNRSPIKRKQLLDSQPYGFSCLQGFKTYWHPDEWRRAVVLSGTIFWCRRTAISVRNIVHLHCSFDIRELPVLCPLTDREMRGTLQSREGPARRDWRQLGPSTGSILPLGHRAGSHRAAETYSSVNDQRCLAAVQALSSTGRGTTFIALS